MGEMLLQAKECHWLLTSQQELRERGGGFSRRPQQGPALPTGRSRPLASSAEREHASAAYAPGLWFCVQAAPGGLHRGHGAPHLAASMGLSALGVLSVGWMQGLNIPQIFRFSTSELQVLRDCTANR